MEKSAYDKYSILDSLGLTSSSEENPEEKPKNQTNKLLCPYCKKELIHVPGKGYMHKNKQQTACNHKLFPSIRNIEEAAEEMKKAEEQGNLLKKDQEQKKEEKTRYKREEESFEIMETRELLQKFTPEQIEEMKKLLQAEDVKEEKTFIPKEKKMVTALQEESIPEIEQKNLEVSSKNKAEEESNLKIPKLSTNGDKILKKRRSKIITITKNEDLIEDRLKKTESISSSSGNDGKTTLLNIQGEKYEIKRAYLVQMSTGEVIDVNKAYFVVGKGKDANFIIDNEFISRMHAAIIRKNDTYYIKDLNSSNGTFLNQYRIPPQTEVEIKNENSFKLANETFEFHYGE